MKRLLSLLTVLLIIVLLCSCSHSTVKSTGDPFVELSVFNDSESDALSFLGEPTDTNIGYISDFEFEGYSYLGMQGNFKFASRARDLPDGDKNIEDMTFVYDYPGAYNWEPSSKYDRYYPNTNELKTAQENWDVIVQHYSDLYGEPVCQNSNKLVWTKETRMQYTEYISIRQKSGLYPGTTAFVVYCSLEQS